MIEKIIYKDLSYKVVGLAMQVHTELGYGFLEKVYENALMVLLNENGIKAEQ
jgi:GxxExxY protein